MHGPAGRATDSRIYDTEAAEPVILSDSEESLRPPPPSAGKADSSPCTGEPDVGDGALDVPAAQAFIKHKGRANTYMLFVFARPLCFLATALVAGREAPLPKGGCQRS